MAKDATKDTKKEKTKTKVGYHAPITVTCNNCGVTYTLGSTQEKLSVNICSQCHPAFTNKQDVFVDTSNRISRFMSRQERAKQINVKAK